MCYVMLCFVVSLMSPVVGGARGRIQLKLTNIELIFVGFIAILIHSKKCLN